MTSRFVLKQIILMVDIMPEWGQIPKGSIPLTSATRMKERVGKSERIVFRGMCEKVLDEDLNPRSDTTMLEKSHSGPDGTTRNTRTSSSYRNARVLWFPKSLARFGAVIKAASVRVVAVRFELLCRDGNYWRRDESFRR